MPKTKVVTVNERGRRVGESHPRAKLTDHEIELIRELAEKVVDPRTGKVSRLGCKRLAEKFEVSPKHIKKILRRETRAQVGGRLKRVPVPAAR